MKAITLILIMAAALLAPAAGMAQRKVTPVESDDKKPAAPTLHYYDKHGDPLDEPVLFLATLDTIAKERKSYAPVYPRLHAAEFGINFADGIMVLAGQHYGGADVWASLSLWNLLFPTVELGVGGAKDTPDGLNYTYKGSPAFYGKLGADCNFLYKGNPDYKILLGVRAGFSSFGWELTDVTVSDSYWGNDGKFDIVEQSTTSIYGELLAGLRVRLIKQWSLGWTFRYRFMLKCNDGSSSRPWYVPGYGARDNHFGFTMSLSYTLPFGSKAASAESAEEGADKGL